ncbi:putative uncharacterized protein DDB_G0292292 [Drosophila guanche]|uniref:putative uncharacterized protein DDB_G0292292 n=1 Tax=Drosophila guanche TaxID=7266 RepID=UPI001471CE3E|nr:putative uncharacterized protein DDB_G0292292 [Drosophila guanche]
MELVILFVKKHLLRESNNLHDNSENNNGNDNGNGENRNNASNRNHPSNPNNGNNNEEGQPGQSGHPGQTKLRDQYPKIDQRTRLLALRHPKRIASGPISPTNQPEVGYRLAEVAAKSEAIAAAVQQDQTAARKESNNCKDK